uniref:heme oxygenase (biliverdin-producing) n=1 Tax=Esox lucius TaxID=8010 RepID=A0AAY5JZ52_ESOLU
MLRLTRLSLSRSDLSEQIKVVTKDCHVRAENTELMLAYQRGDITMEQYKLLLCSLHEIYQALEEALDSNSNHSCVAPIYFPLELARLESLEKDLEHFYGHNWREKIVVPAATKRYVHRLRQIGKDNPEYLVAHAYTRYLGDLSGGTVLGRITQKSLGLKSGEGLLFFSFPGVSSPNRFKQLYRSRMNSIELNHEDRKGVLDEAVRAFELNIQVFDDLQKMLSEMKSETKSDMPSKMERESTSEKLHMTGCTRHLTTHSKLAQGEKLIAKSLQIQPSLINSSPFFRMLLGICVALVTVGMGIYAL